MNNTIKKVEPFLIGSEIFRALIRMLIKKTAVAINERGLPARKLNESVWGLRISIQITQPSEIYGRVMPVMIKTRNIMLHRISDNTIRSLFPFLVKSLLSR